LTLVFNKYSVLIHFIESETSCGVSWEPKSSHKLVNA